MNQFFESIQEYISEADFSLVSLVLLSVLGISWIVQLFFYLYYYNAVIRRQKQEYRGQVTHEIKRHPVSIIVTARYATEELEKFLPLLLDQNYPKYEVVVVNDGATEASTVLLDKLKSKHTNLKTSFLPMNAKYMSRRKMCITIGKMAASYDYIIVTDSDCEPTSRDWLSEMMRNFTPEKEIVLGYSHQEQDKPGFFASLLRFDNLFGAIKYMGYACHGLAYKGTTNNMAFRRETFDRCKAYASSLNLEKGEDDVFVSENNNGSNVAVELSTSSIITSHKEMTFKKYLFLKDSNVETGSLYPSGIKFRIGLEVATRMLYYISLISLIAYSLVEGEFLATGIATLAGLIRYGIQCYTFTTAAHIFNEKGYAFKFMIFEILIPILTLYIISFGRIGKKRQDLWKM